MRSATWSSNCCRVCVSGRDGDFIREEGVAGIADHEGFALQALGACTQIQEAGADADENLLPVMSADDSVIG